MDAAADSRTPRVRAVDEGAGAVQHLDRLGEFGRHKLARGDAVQAAEADIIARQGKAANDEQFARDAKAQRGADRRVVFQHLAQRLRLLVKDQRLLVGLRSEEHTSELQSLMRISYAVFCLKKKN